MADRLSWWVIPGALVVLLRVATLAAPTPEPEVDSVAAPATVGSGHVVVRDASGERSVPIPAVDLVRNPFVLTVPADFVGQSGSMTLWRRLSSGREATPWLEVRPRVRSDATIPISGLTPGRYDVELRFDNGGSLPCLLRADDRTAPGHVSLVPALPASPVR